MEKEWRLLKDGLRDGASNMALDETMLWAGIKRLIRPTLRLYGWSRPTVSIGYAQDARKDIDLERCQELDLGLVRRPTGGRAVLHEHELTYSLVAPEKVFSKPSSILEIYKEISGALIAGLSLLGIEAQLVPVQRSKMPPSAFCFSSPSAYEVAVQGNKLVGSAQKRSRGYVLQQGSIIIDIDQGKLAAIFKHSSPRSCSAMTSINEVREDLVEFTTLQEAIQEGFCLAWGIRFLEEGLTSYETRVAQELEQRKYQLPQWNLTRPRFSYDPGPV